MQANGKRRLAFSDRGNTLFIMAGIMVVLLAVAALAIDLVTFYAARVEAQRAADAAALAGAQAFMSSNCTTLATGCVAGGPQEATAKALAEAAGNANSIYGANADIQDSDISFSYPNSYEPQITVAAARDANHLGPLPTIFGKVLGIQTVNVSATATAEAFNPSGTGDSIGANCLKPWLFPNCDPDHTGGTGTAFNANCLGGQDAFVTGSASNESIVHPGLAPTGVIGETFVVKPGDPSAAPAPSQFYPVVLPPNPNSPSLCPAAASTFNGTGGAALYEQNICCCNEYEFVCGQSVTVSFETGNMQGPTEHGVECLINENQNTGTGQDTLNSASPISITGGSNNLVGAWQGQSGLTQSPSIQTVPLYAGYNLCPGSSCPGTSNVTIVGFLQVFITSVDTPGPSQGSVHVTVLNVAGCGGGTGSSSSSSTTPVSTTGSFIPIRLIHQ
jgi:hypothetical protein